MSTVMAVQSGICDKMLNMDGKNPDPIACSAGCQAGLNLAFSTCKPGGFARLWLCCCAVAV